MVYIYSFTGKRERPAPQKGMGKGRRAKREKGTPPSGEFVPVLTGIQTARTHDTKRNDFPVRGGGCLKANSLLPTSDIDDPNNVTRTSK